MPSFTEPTNKSNDLGYDAHDIESLRFQADQATHAAEPFIEGLQPPVGNPNTSYDPSQAGGHETALDPGTSYDPSQAGHHDSSLDPGQSHDLSHDPTHYMPPGLEAESAGATPGFPDPPDHPGYAGDAGFDG